MSKSVVLVLEPNHESEYGEYANIPAFNAHGDIIGWTGGEVPESGHSCEFNVLNDEGFTTCASSTTVNKLRGENAKLRAERDHWRVEQVHAYGNWEDTYKRASELEAENAKLRRLVRTYRACHDHVDACRACSELPDCEALEKMRSIGREVGIEV